MACIEGALPAKDPLIDQDKAFVVETGDGKVIITRLPTAR